MNEKRKELAMSERVYEVSGMTCAHCVAAVTEEVSAVPGVREVQVDLETGRVAVRGQDADEDAVRAAVLRAGYTLA
ncbi:MAG TPA: heavy-metal-associated domain-containing protein [Solirubrobacteraceae bacterium]|nr:heavy-metal-associated domain-containing protein [Solirubrobacteraceae bacterium]